MEDLLKIRELAITNFSIDNIKKGEPNTVLEDIFVPLYFFHRYQTEAVSKLIGGLDYNYSNKGDHQTVVNIVDARTQKEALTENHLKERLELLLMLLLHQRLPPI